MVVVKCIRKIRNRHGKIIGYQLQDKNNVIKNVESSELKRAMHGNQISVVNLTLTKDNRLVDKGHIEKHKTLSNAPTQRRLDMEQLVNKARTLGLVQSIDESYLIKTGKSSYILYIPDKVEEAPEVFNEVEECETLKVVGGIGLTSTEKMFYGCSFDVLDISELITKNVTDMTDMFYDCQVYSELKLGKFYTGRVRNMDGMFMEYSGVPFDLSILDTSNVISMSSMFYGCGMEDLDLSNFNVSQVKYTDSMFKDCTALNIILWDTRTKNLQSMEEMFSGCEIDTLDISNIDTTNVTSMSGAFKSMSCSSLDFSHCNMDKVRNTARMFENSVITTIHLPKFGKRLTNTEAMFRGSMINYIDLNNIDTSHVTSMNSMFNECRIPNINISKLDTKRVVDMEEMFSGANTKSIDISNFNVESVESMQRMFNYCTVNELNLGDIKINNSCVIDEIFDECSVKKVHIKDSKLLMAFECRRQG